MKNKKVIAAQLAGEIKLYHQQWKEEMDNIMEYENFGGETDSGNTLERIFALQWVLDLKRNVPKETNPPEEKKSLIPTP